jgi:tetratricopeptide (TPR) repeat protein
MSYYFSILPSRHSLAAGLAVAAMIVAFSSVLFAQPADKSGKAAPQKGLPAAGDEDASSDSANRANQPVKFDTKLLIGDAVDDADAPQYRQVMNAIDKFRNRDFKAARDLLAEARTDHPELPPVEVLMAKLFIVAQQPQMALAELEQAVRRSPKDPEAYLMFADASISERRITAAEQLYIKADSLIRAFDQNPKRKENFEKRVLVGLALVAESRAQWAEAEKLLQDFLKIDPKNAGVYQRLGRALFQQATPGNKKRTDSYQAFQKALQIDPKAIDPDIAMGQLFEQAAQEALQADDQVKFDEYRKEATRFFKRATDAPKAPLGSHLAAATWALQTSQFPLAQQYADSAMKLDPESVDAKLVRALVARFAGDLRTAERLLNEAIIDSPGFNVSNQLALVLIELQDSNKRNRALQLAELNAKAYPQNVEAASTLGWIYYRLNRDSDAERVLNAVIRSGQLSADAAYYVSKIFSDQGRNADAIQVLEMALANPQPFANRNKATDLLSELKRKADTRVPTTERDDRESSAKESATKAGGAKGTTAPKGATKSKTTK